MDRCISALSRSGWGRDPARKELHEAADQLTADQAGLLVVGEPTIGKGLDQALAKAAKVVKRRWRPRPAKIASELQEALEG